MAEDLIAAIMTLAKIDPSLPMSLYVNSPGGAVAASIRIVRAMDTCRLSIATINLGRSDGTAAIMVGHGAKDSRFALPTSSFQLEPISMSGLDAYPLLGGNPIESDHNDMAAILARDTGRGLPEVSRNMRQRLFLDPFQARSYGLIDQVIDRTQDAI